MIILDLACASSKSWDSSLNMLEMAKNRIPKVGATTPVSELPSSSVVPSVIGVKNFLDGAVQLVKLGLSPEGSSEVLERYYKRSLSVVLQTGTLPTKVADLKTYSVIMTELDKGLKRVDRAVHEARKNETRQLLLQGKDEMAAVTVGEKPVVRGAMKHLMMTLSKQAPYGGLTSHLLK